MKSLFTRLQASLVLAILIFLSACHPIRSVSFSQELRQDTVMYTGGADYLGDFLVRIGTINKDRNRKEGLLSAKEESQEVFQFTLCKKDLCIEGESSYYIKTKSTGSNYNDKSGLTKIKAEKLQGIMRFNKEEALNFMVNVGGKKPGQGFLKFPGDTIIQIEPISKKSTYGKSAYSVGLEYKRDGKKIGGFIQMGEVINIVIKNSESERVRMILAAVSIALVNRSNVIRIF